MYAYIHMLHIHTCVHPYTRTHVRMHAHTYGCTPTNTYKGLNLAMSYKFISSAPSTNRLISSLKSTTKCSSANVQPLQIIAITICLNVCMRVCVCVDVRALLYMYVCVCRQVCMYTYTQPLNVHTYACILMSSKIFVSSFYIKYGI